MILTFNLNLFQIHDSLIDQSLFESFYKCKKPFLETLVVFVDLVKNFDTIYYKIFLNVLSKFDIPQYLITITQKLCNNFMIEIKVGKAKTNRL